jgi:hypothetical protein
MPTTVAILERCTIMLTFQLLFPSQKPIQSRHLGPPSPLLVSRQVIGHLLVPCQGGLLHPLDLLLQLQHEALGGNSTPRDEGPAGLCSAKVWPGEESIARAMYAMWIGWVSLLMGRWSGVQSRYSLRR